MSEVKNEGRRMGGKHCMLTVDQLRAELADAKETITRYEVTAENCEVLRAELAAIKAQEPVAWMLKNEKGRIEEILPYMPCASDMQPYWPEPLQLYAAPVAKASIGSPVDDLRIDAEALGLSVEVAPVAKQVVMPEHAKIRMPCRMWEDQNAESPEFARGHNTALDYVARLNAADHAEGDI